MYYKNHYDKKTIITEEERNNKINEKKKYLLEHPEEYCDEFLEDTDYTPYDLLYADREKIQAEYPEWCARRAFDEIHYMYRPISDDEARAIKEGKHKVSVTYTVTKEIDTAVPDKFIDEDEFLTNEGLDYLYDEISDKDDCEIVSVYDDNIGYIYEL